MLLLACGRHAQPLLRAARTPDGRRHLDSGCSELNRIRYVPMLLVRGSRLPRVSGIFETHALSLFTHPVAADESMWIVTPTGGHQSVRRDFDPSREHAPAGAVLSEAAARLRALVPEVRERRDKDLRFSFYFGGKIDHPEGGNGRYVDGCGLSNLRLAWPGVWSLSLINAPQIVDEMRSSRDLAGAFDPARPQLDLAVEGLKAAPPVGEELRLSASTTWHAWSEFEKLQRIV